MNRAAPLGWFGIARLGLVQAAIGAIVMLATSLLNRVMVVEYASVATLPAGLVAWHYAVQLTRPRWGHGADRGWRRTPWIIAGMVVLALGAMLATWATTLLTAQFWPALALAVLAYALIGVGVGAAGTTLLALLASRTAEARRPAAASLTWIMMIVGIVITAAIAGRLIDPFGPERLLLVAGGVCLAALGVAALGIIGVEGRPAIVASAPPPAAGIAFNAALAAIWRDPLARTFTLFVFVAMLAYATQDLILEPFAGLVFGLTPGGSTQLSGVQHQGVLLGMILVGVAGHGFGRQDSGSQGSGRGLRLRPWIIGGCVASALALLGLAFAAEHPRGWPLAPTVFALGFANGVFAVAAIGAMLDLAGRGGPGVQKGGHEGIRMGLWGAAQAAAFGLGGLFGASAVDAGRALIGADGPAFAIVFTIEAALFVVAAAIAARLTERPPVLTKEVLA